MLIQTLQSNWDYFAYFSKMIWHLKVRWHSVMYSCSELTIFPSFPFLYTQITKSLAEKKNWNYLYFISFHDLKSWGFYICKTHVALCLWPVMWGVNKPHAPSIFFKLQDRRVPPTGAFWRKVIHLIAVYATFLWRTPNCL